MTQGRFMIGLIIAVVALQYGAVQAAVEGAWWMAAMGEVLVLAVLVLILRNRG